MIRKLIPFLLVASLTACANTGAPSSSSPSASSSPSSSSSSSTSSTSSSSATSSQPSSGLSNIPGYGEKSCDASALQSQIGQKATESVMENLRKQSGSSTARMLRPGQLVTMEYNAGRLNLILDDKDVMTAIRCG